MHRFGMVIGAGLFVGALIAVYKYLLPQEAKDDLKNLAKQGVQLGKDVHDNIVAKEEAAEQDRIDANRSYVADQWAQAGF